MCDHLVLLSNFQGPVAIKALVLLLLLRKLLDKHRAQQECLQSNLNRDEAKQYGGKSSYAVSAVQVSTLGLWKAANKGREGETLW